MAADTGPTARARTGGQRTDPVSRSRLVINRNPRCVYVSDTLGRAEIVATWLNDQEIAADVMDTATLGGFDGKTSITPWVASNRGIEAWVPEGDVDRAQELLVAKTEEFRLIAELRASRT